MAKPFHCNRYYIWQDRRMSQPLRILACSISSNRSALGKLATLQQFLKDYQDKFQEAAKNGMSPSDLRNFQDFIYRLDQAIKQQQGVIELTTHSVNAGRIELNEAQRKMQSFDTLAQRHIHAENIKEAKIEQKMQDEYSGRFAIYKAAEKNNDELEGVNHE
jgi:flagellar FliJ protein